MIFRRALRLSPPPHEILLVPASDAAVFLRDGEVEAVAPGAAEVGLARLRSGGSDPAALRQFASDVGVEAVTALQRMSTDRVLAILQAWLRDRRLVAVKPEGTSGARARASDPGERVAAQVLFETKGALWILEGNRYELLPGPLLKKAKSRPDGGGTVVPPDKAAALLARYEMAPAATPRLTALFKEAIPLLAPPWSRIETARGLVLLRHDPPRSATSRPDGDALTPSAVRKEAATDFLELEVVYEDDGSPYEGSIEVELPDGKKEIGSVDDQGHWHLGDVVPGTAKVTLVNTDQAGVTLG